MSSPLFEKLSASGGEVGAFLQSVQPIVLARHPEPLLPGVEDNACWIWQGLVSSDGVAYEYREPVYRRAYRLLVGTIPPGLRVERTCGGKLCVNPRHLKLSTTSEIAQRSHGMTAQDHADIRKALAAGEQQSAIARRFGISAAAVSAIKSKVETRAGFDQAPRDQAPARSLAEWLDRQDGRLGPVGRLARGESMTDAARETALSKATKEYMTYSLLLREYEARLGRERAGEAAK
jgi:hypothetical protein